MELRGVPAVDVVRGPLVESVHAIAACAVDRNGRVVYGLGSIDVPVFLRSTAKPFIAAAAVRAGVVERFGLTPEEIAVMAASHTGEPYHVSAVESILRKIGLPESALQCGAHAPYDDASAARLASSGEAPRSIHNNCSGKHAGILALSLALGADPAHYMDDDHPAQREILSLCARCSDETMPMPLGIDGCGIPVYATTLEHAAHSFVRLAALDAVDASDARALQVVRDAMIAFPEYVSGTNAFDAALMRAGEGRIACKSGAEGVHGTGLLDRGVGLVVKVADGAPRGRAPSVVEILRVLGALDSSALQRLKPFAQPSVRNHAGAHVGMVRANAGAIASGVR